MKKMLNAIIFSLVCIIFSACGTTSDRNTNKESKSATVEKTDLKNASGYRNIKPGEAKKRLDTEKGIILLDVRTKEEYAEKHIPNSLLIPVDVIDKEAPLKLTDKKSTIFVYCRSGRRSVTASEALVKMGYTNVYNLGGINEWPFETEGAK